MRDEQRHMAPRHRLAAELSDQEQVADGCHPTDPVKLKVSRWGNGPASPAWQLGVVVPQSDGVFDRSQELSCSKHHRGTTMEHYAGIDVSLESASVCVVEAGGRIVREAKVASEPDALIALVWQVGGRGLADRVGSGSAVAVAVCGHAGGGASGGAAGDPARA